MAQGSATGGSPQRKKVVKERPLRSVGGVTHTTVSATDLDIRDLASATDSVTVGNAAGAGVYVRPGTSAVFQVQSNSSNVATETTLSAINNKLVTGTDIGDVTINNGSAGSAVNIQDGGNTITVDGTVNTIDFYPNLAEGGLSTRTPWSKIGYNGAVTTEQDIAPWLASGSTPALIYSFPAAELAMTIVSSSDSDAGVTGAIKTSTLGAGGASYQVNDLVTVVRAPGTGGVVKVLSLGGGGAVATYENHTCGSGYTTGAATTTGGSGDGNFTLNIDTVSTQGTGARTVTVYWLDDGFIETGTTVTMNGDTPVKINDGIYRINNARVITTGSSNAPVGNLSIKNSTSTYGYISATKTRQRQMIYTIPTGKTLYVTNISFSCSGQSASKTTRFTTRANFNDKTGLVMQRGLFMPFHEILLNNTAFEKELQPPTKLPATTDIKVSAFADSAAVVSCALRGYLVTS